MKSIVTTNHLTHEYKEYDAEDNVIGSYRALKEITLEINEGDFVTVLGHNGSGKSTLAKHLNALLLPTEGEVFVCEKNTKNADPIWELRRDAGMIFQNPDNQIIGMTVEEDVAFGQENIGIASDEMEKRIGEVLEKVDMSLFRYESPNQLSGGQKQRVAIAGILSMKPKCILLDEPTAMLDPIGRKEVLETLHELNRKEKITVILITHHMEEAVKADRVIVMDRGEIFLSGTPREVFSHYKELEKIRLSVPQVTQLAFELKEAGIPLPDCILSIPELTEALWNLR